MLKDLLESEKIPDDYLKKEWEAAFKKAELQIIEQTEQLSNKWLEPSTFTLTCLEQTQPGSTIIFNGYECVVLNPIRGLVIFKKPVISMPFDKSGSNIPSTSKKGNIFHQLNTTFLDGIRPKLKKLIRPSTWICNDDYSKEHSIYAHVSLPSYDDIIQVLDFDIDIQIGKAWLRDISNIRNKRSIFDSLQKSDRAIGLKNYDYKSVIAKSKMDAFPTFNLHPRSEIYDGVITGSLSPIYDCNESDDSRELHELPPYSIINFTDFLCLLINPQKGYLFMLDSLGETLFDTHEPTWYGKNNPNNIQKILNEVFYTKIPEPYRSLIMKSHFTKINTYIGLISKEEWEMHSAYIHNTKYTHGDGWGWTRTMVEGRGDSVLTISPSGKLNSIWEINDEEKFPVHPTFYLSPNTTVDRFGKVLKTE